MTTRELERLLDLLGTFSEDPDIEGSMADDIGRIRDALWDRLEARGR